MKRIPVLITPIFYCLLSVSVPVYAIDAVTTETPQQQTRQKNECILLAIKCGNTILSIQDKIELLKEEINKGSAVYTLDELNTLKQKLNDVSKTLDYLLDK